MFEGMRAKGSRFLDTIPCKTRSRSVPDVVVLNSRTLVGLLIKCQRLPRSFFWNSSSPFASLLIILGREVIRDRKGGKRKNREKEEKRGIF